MVNENIGVRDVTATYGACAVVWGQCRDRQAVSFPFFIRCRDACPALVLRTSIIAEIVRVMKSSQKHTKLLGRCTSLKSTPEHTVLSNSPLRLIGKGRDFDRLFACLLGLDNIGQ
jgi:hypothetical protein